MEMEVKETEIEEEEVVVVLVVVKVVVVIVVVVVVVDEGVVERITLQTSIEVILSLLMI